MTEDEYLEKWELTEVNLNEWRQYGNIDHWFFLNQMYLEPEHISEIEKHQLDLYLKEVENAVNYRIDKYKNRHNFKIILKEQLRIINEFMNSLEYKPILNDLMNTIIYINKDDYVPILLKMQDAIKIEFSGIDDLNIYQIDSFRKGHYFTANVLYKYKNRIEYILKNDKEQEQNETHQPLKKQFKFENHFDFVDSNEVYSYFYEKLVSKRMLNEKDLQEYLIQAFQECTPPKKLFRLKDISTKQNVNKIFYNYFKDVAQKPHGKRKNYAELLGKYFEGFKTENVMTNWSK